MRASLTLRDVADEAKVSIKTVSRVLNGEPHVRAPVREHVQAVLDRLGYRPNLAARRLGGHRSYLIVTLTFDPEHAYPARLQIGAAMRCKELGYHLVLEPMSRLEDFTEALIRDLEMKLDPDGIILFPPFCDEMAVLQAIRTADVPLVRISPERPFDYGKEISLDDRTAAQSIMEHLVALGHRRIGILTGPDSHVAAVNRLAGYRDIVEQAGLADDPALIQAGDFTFERGRAGAVALLSLAERPTAIFASNDNMAAGVIAAARELGVSVPGQLSVAGFDDAWPADRIWPSLTTIRQPFLEMGMGAVSALIDPDVPIRQIYDFELMIRASTGAPGRA